MKIDEGEGIIENVRAMRQVHQDVSLLLRTAKDLMKEGWVTDSTKCLSNHSGSVNSPKTWMPHYLFLFFKNTKRPNLVCFVSVILDDIYHDGFLDFPVASAGVVVYKDGVDAAKKYEYWHSAAAIWGIQQHCEFGEPVEIHSKDIEENKGKASKLIFLKQPLSTIQNSSDLTERLVAPLKNILDVI